MVLLGVVSYMYPLRWDLTSDKRYSLSDATKTLLADLPGQVDVEVLLDGDLNSGFRRLRRSTLELVDEMSRYGQVRSVEPKTNSTDGLQPTVIHEREQNGKTVQTTVFPYARVTYGGRQTVVPLLRNNRALNGEQNLNKSIEGLEYAFAEAIHSISRDTIERIAFLEGHGELSEADVYDVSRQLSRYFDVDRGALTNDVRALDRYKVVIVAAPQEPLNEKDKYILDQYVMHGGRVLWAIDGVRLSEEMLSSEGLTPIIPLDVKLTDMLFRYGVRVNPVLVQDSRGCVGRGGATSIPTYAVDVCSAVADLGQFARDKRCDAGQQRVCVNNRYGRRFGRYTERSASCHLNRFARDARSGGDRPE